ncbi:hypothetical protein GCM10009679_77530 [Saccharothrix algeriensis]|uniref:Uncharacterized protein n=1 Tax=Catellatospora bangladeshensis TaxID=310355 RepID=A0A8J3JC48_9ACTN|nr:hypothetical protein Cba03nite_34910 [Catellatospora bangladeshensis]
MVRVTCTVNDTCQRPPVCRTVADMIRAVPACRQLLTVQAVGAFGGALAEVGAHRRQGPVEREPVRTGMAVQVTVLGRGRVQGEPVRLHHHTTSHIGHASRLGDPYDKTAIARRHRPGRARQRTLEHTKAHSTTSSWIPLCRPA